MPVFHRFPLRGPTEVTHMAEFRPVILALLPVLKEAFRHGISEVLFEVVHRLSDDGEFLWNLRSSYDTKTTRVSYDRDAHRAIVGTLVPLRSCKGLAKRLAPLMDEALATVAPGLLAAWANTARTFDAALIGRIELELGRDWEVTDFIPTVVRIHPDSPFRYLL